MPSNTASERSDVSGGSAKTSLLWAYQLRREHVHLVERIDDMNTQLISSINAAQTYEQNLSRLESLVKTLQAENYSLDNEVTLMRTNFTAKIEDINQQITQIGSGNDAVKDVTKELELEFKGIGLQVSELLKSVSELKREIATLSIQKGAAATQEMDIEPTQDDTDLAKVESISGQIETRPRRLVTLSLGKKRDHLVQSSEPAVDLINVPDSMPNQTAIPSSSGLTDVPDSTIINCMPPPKPYDHIFQQIHQNGRTISEYFALTSELRSQMPRRKQEGHIVEAFFDGITEDTDGAAFKTSLEEYLDKAGWIWSNLEAFCKPRALRNKRRAIYNTRARSRANALASQKEGNLQV